MTVIPIRKWEDNEDYFRELLYLNYDQMDATVARYEELVRMEVQDIKELEDDGRSV